MIRGKNKTVVVLLQQGIGDTLMGISLLKNIESELDHKSKMLILVKTELEKSVIQSVQFNCNTDIICVPREGRIRKYFSLFMTALQLRFLHPTILIAPLLFPRIINVLWIRLINAEISVGVPGKWNRYGFDRIVNREPGEHYVEYFVRFGEAVGFPQKNDPDNTIPIATSMQTQARSMMPDWNSNQCWIAIGPGSGEKESFKRWPVYHFRKLVKFLLQNSDHIRIAIFCSKEEESLVESILSDKEFDLNRCFIFSGKQFNVALALIAQCHCMVAGCTGPLHMAVSAGIPVVGLYGPSNPGFEGAYKNHYVMRPKNLECAPCCGGEWANKGCNDPICMDLIQPRSVYEAVLKVLNGSPPPPVPWVPTSRILR